MGSRLSGQGLIRLVLVLLIGATCTAAQLADVAAFEEHKDSPDIESSGITITKRVDEVNLIFTVTDSKGHFVSALQSQLRCG